MKIAKFAGMFLLIMLATMGLWYLQPWSDYSPAKIASLEDPDKLVWNMQNMRELIPATTIKQGSEKVFSENPQPLTLNYQFDGQPKSLEQFLTESTTTGLMVIKDGTIVHEQYRHGANQQTLFTSWSMAKSFVATAVAMAVKEGAISSFDDRVEQYAVQFAGSDYGRSRIDHLLVMSSGINFVEEYGDGPSDVRPFFFNSFVLGKNPDLLLKPFTRNRAPLSDLDYISANSHVLSAVLRGAYQQSLAEILTNKIWRPLGMEADANWLQHRDDEAGQALGYCCLNARLRDYGRFGEFYLQAALGAGLGPDVLPQGWVDKLSLPATKAHTPGGEKYGGRGYSHHFWLPINAPGVFVAAGIYGQYIWIDPANNIVIARTSADPEWTPRYPESEAVFKAIVEHLK